MRRNKCCKLSGMVIIGDRGYYKLKARYSPKYRHGILIRITGFSSEHKIYHQLCIKCTNPSTLSEPTWLHSSGSSGTKTTHEWYCMSCMDNSLTHTRVLTNILTSRPTSSVRMLASSKICLILGDKSDYWDWMVWAINHSDGATHWPQLQPAISSPSKAVVSYLISSMMTKTLHTMSMHWAYNMVVITDPS